MAPSDAVAQDQAAKIEALRNRPTFDPAGAYELTTTIPGESGREPATMTIEVRRAGEGFTGRLTSPSAPEAPVVEVSAGGDRMWVTADVPERGRIEFRMRVSGERVSGTWIGGIETNGVFSGSKHPL
jgi:hypothetical protein